MDRRSKQVIVIRKDLNMRKGKIASQAAHASMKVILDLMPRMPHPRREDVFTRTLRTHGEGPLENWIGGSFTKITVSVNSEEELREVYKKAQDAGLLTSLIEDSGRTEFHGVVTATAVAIGPAWEDEIDPITSHLPLL